MEEVKKSSTRGGARPGAGRKPRMNFEARELFYMRVDAFWEKIMEKIEDYVEKGDKDIIKMIIEQRIGKPAQSVDHTTQGKEFPSPILANVHCHNCDQKNNSPEEAD